MKRWYVVHAYSGFEKSVAQALRDRIVRNDMQEKFGDVLVPTEEVVEMRSGQKRRSERKFFPGYVLVQIETHDEAGIPRMDNESWHLVKETSKVLGFIGGTADRPLPIRDEEAAAILDRVQEGVEKPRPKVLFEPGEMVRVTDGPFNDFNGVVEEVNYEKSRLRVAVLIFGAPPRWSWNSARSRRPDPLPACLRHGLENPVILRGSLSNGVGQGTGRRKAASVRLQREAGTRDFPGPMGSLTPGASTRRELRWLRKLLVTSSCR